MNAWELQRIGVEGLTAVERAPAPLGPHDVRLAVRAASLNFRDVLMVKGQYDPRLKLPLVPLSDGVGVVTEVGASVSRVKAGERVCGLFAQGWLAGEPTKERSARTLGGPLDGMLRSEAVLHEEGVVAVPAHLTDEEAATLPCAALTAWSALVTQGAMRPGQSVLIQGTGGVALFALQFAKLLGLRTLLVSTTPSKLERAKAMGVDVAIDGRATPEWDREVKRATDGIGVDHVVEVGGAGTLDRSLRSVRNGGTVSVIGVLAGGAGPVSLLPVLMRNLRLQGVFVGHREGFEAMNRAIALHALRPVVDRVFPFTEAPAALTHLEAAGHFGKVVVRTST